VLPRRAALVKRRVITPVGMTGYAVIFLLSVLLPSAGAQYARTPGPQYYLLLVVGPVEVVVFLIWLLLRREMGVKAAIASARWVVPVSFFLSAIVIYLGASSYQWGIL